MVRPRPAAPSVRPDWLRRARTTTHRALVLAARPTHRARMLPGFLIVGAERCGTTSMFHVPGEHPACSVPLLRKQEVHYFDVAFTPGLDWYQLQFPVQAVARPDRPPRRGGPR